MKLSEEMEADSSGGAPDGWVLIRVHVPELNVQKSLQFPKDQLVWDVKQQCLAALPKELKESFNYGLFCPPVNGKAGKFLDEERRLGEYPFNGPVGYLELKYKRRVYKMLKLDEKALKSLHSRTNLRRFIEHVSHSQLDKITKACNKGLDPNFHCQESGETPLAIAAGLKNPGKVIIALVNGGALLDYRTKDGTTAIHRAVEKNSLEAVKTLLDLGASPNYKDAKSLTPLYYSVTHKTDPLLCETLLHDHATIGAQDLQGWQEVHQACRNGLVQHLDHLLFYGADMNGRNASGNTPLHVCAVNAQDSCARQLLFRGCDREALNFANQTPYQVAVIAGNLELAEVIKNYKSDDIVEFRGPPRYNPRRRSAIRSIWGGVPGDRSSLASSTRIPDFESVMMDRPFSSASSSLSDHSQRSQDDNASVFTDKSAGDTSDIISNSSGIGTSNSDTTTCSLQLPGATVVCLEPYDSGTNGHLRLNLGDVIEVTGVTDDGLIEGCIRGQNVTGLFPSHVVQEVKMRARPQSANSMNNGTLRMPGRREVPLSKTYSATAPRIKKKMNVLGSVRTVVLARSRRGFGFVLRGAKASSPLMSLQPSPRCPALQYLDHVDRGGVAHRAGLRRGDFLLQINNEDVSCASHERVVELIRKSGALVSMTVVSLDEEDSIIGNGLENSATLPRRAPAPPRRAPTTALSVGRARAASMLPQLENENEKGEMLKSPTGDWNRQSRTTQLEDLFQHHHQNDSNSGMMTTSTFQDGGSDSPPYSPAKSASGRVYASVAEMKRSRTKQNSRTATIGRAGLRRAFHSTPDLAPPAPPAPPMIPTPTGGETNAPARARSQEDVHVANGVIPSSFRPGDAAKLYASPAELARSISNAQARKNQPVNNRNSTNGVTSANPQPTVKANSLDESQYAQPYSSQQKPHFKRQMSNPCPPPPIPEPDYSMSESDEEGKHNNKNGSNNGACGTLSAAALRRARGALRPSASVPSDLAADDNSSSGVSSDQEPPPTHKVSFNSHVTVKTSSDEVRTEPVHGSSESLASIPAPPPAPAPASIPMMQRHNSLTRKRAQQVNACRLSAAERLGVDARRAPGSLRRAAASLASLPPPPEAPEIDSSDDIPMIAPPPQFSDRNGARVVSALPKRLASLDSFPR